MESYYLTIIIVTPAIILFILWLTLTLIFTTIFKNNESKIKTYDDTNSLIKDELRQAYNSNSRNYIIEGNF